MRILTTIAAVGIASLSTACATKGFVRSEVADLSTKVDTLTRSVEETQQRTEQNEELIHEVDARADARADEIGLWAKDAQALADSASTSAAEATAKAEDVDKFSKRLLYEVVLSEAEGSFAFAKAELPPAAMTSIDALIEQLKADPRGAYVEIEGHTDNVGPSEVNQRLGLERAEAVKRYLYEVHRVPLHKMSVISYGEDRPAAPNTSKDGRAQNRRVVIKVLA
jgi:outer membrane protein OmpA-like peptidoglycan-associated protein